VDVSTTGAVNVASGWATIKPVKGGTLTSLTFTPKNPNLFSDFNFRGQLLKVGKITLTVQDNQGDPAQTFTFHINKANQDFPRIGIIANPGSGETIKSVTITSAGFKEVKQVSFSHVVPEPSSLTLHGIGGAGPLAFHRRRPTAVA
jgi:hypothetical protein